MRFHRVGATGATLLVVAMLAAACSSGGSSSTSTSTTTGTPLASTFVFGGPPECATRQTCLLGLQSVYGLHFKDFKALDAGGPLTKSALANGQIQLARLFSSDESIQKKGFVLLNDDKHFQLAGNIVPVVRTSKAAAEVTSLLNATSAALTQPDLVAINDAIDNSHADPGDQATAFIQKKGLNKGATPGAKESLTIGSANFAESVALADIYGGVLKDAGYSVTFKLNLGAREVIEPALESGQLDLIPEYVGNYLNFIDQTVQGGLTLDQTVTKLNTEIAPKGLEVLTPSGAADADAIAVTQATATKYGLVNISDLGKKV
jgi:osmoprotectant transport system substrate-binding protein